VKKEAKKALFSPPFLRGCFKFATQTPPIQLATIEVVGFSLLGTILAMCKIFVVGWRLLIRCVFVKEILTLENQGKKQNPNR
jgi:hypothetical protein